MDLYTSPLDAEHRAAGAKFSAFGGWSMPLEYADSGVLAEHQAVRERAGLFDVSHLGKLLITGPGAVDFVNGVFTADLAKIGAGQAQYTLLCAEDGGVVDDLIVYRFSDSEIWAVPNAANTAAVQAVLAQSAPAGVEITDRHHDVAVLAVQGPESDAVLAAAGLPVGHGYLRFVLAEASEQPPIVVCRTGYTGERGYELLVPAEQAPQLWDDLLTAGEPVGLRRAGLAARDTLRTEMGYPLHGQDLTAEITPVQARLGWAVGWGKESFVGQAALQQEKAAGPARVLRGLRATGRGIPRPGMSVLSATGDELGQVTSGTFSPTTRAGIGLALLSASVREGDRVHVAVRSRTEPFEVVRPPFVPSHTT